MTLRALFHVNHLWGVGHFSRIAAIANAVITQGGSATILTGNTPVAGRCHPNVRLVGLPLLRSPDTGYATLVDAVGMAPTPDLWQSRERLIEDTLAKARPDIVVIETFPFGRRKLSAELLHLIAAAKSHKAAIVCSVRDLPTPPADARRLDECAARLRDHFDAVLVHGDPNVFALQDVWPGDVPAPTHMTGYVLEDLPTPRLPHRHGVVVSAGGGGDAAPLLQAAMAARTGFPPDESWTFVAGPNAPQALYDDLLSRLQENDTLARFLPDLPQHIARAKLSISRGGYNTVAETLAAGTPAVIVPFAPEGEPEQAQRAARLAELGLLVALPEPELTVESLTTAIHAALARALEAPQSVNLDGAVRSASLLAEIAAAR